MSSFLKPIFILFVFIFSQQSLLAELCAPDDVPGATLLVPYFEVSIPSDCSKARFDTEVAITNTGAAPALANVVIWSEWSVPLLSFTLYLTGFDSDSFSLSDVVCRGLVRNEDDGSSESYATNTIENAKAILTGRESPVTNMCGGQFKPRNKAIGYITIDNVDSENPGFPSDGASYMNALLDNNIFVGDVYYIDNKAKGATRVCGRGNSNCIRRFKKAIFNTRGKPGVKAVSIEAGSFSGSSRTFYGRYNGGAGTDNREPLPNVYHVRYQNTQRRKKFDLIVWREGNSTFNTVACDSEPNWRPMGSTQLVVFDHLQSSDPVQLELEDEPLGLAAFTDEVTTIKKALDGIEFEKGWLFLNLGTVFSEDDVYGDGTPGAYILARRDGTISDTGVHAFQVNPNCDPT